ncbi:Rid family hydrolase [Acinetobacter sp. YH12096]|jgi:Putative translation initiation inhibitor, yjgF family|nr:Rid family hydrolase [Acinetobacter sp. YH12096]
MQFLNPKTLYNPQPYGYSHVAVIQQPCKIVHISGQGGENIHGQLSMLFELQLQQAFFNLQLALQAAQAQLHEIAALRILITDYNPQKHQQLIQCMQQYWENQVYPACTLIPVPCLALADMQIEIEATAYCYESNGKN